MMWFKDLWIEIRYNKYYYLFHTVGDIFMLMVFFRIYPLDLSKEIWGSSVMILSILWFVLFFYLSHTYKDAEEIREKDDFAENTRQNKNKGNLDTDETSQERALANTTKIIPNTEDTKVIEWAKDMMSDINVETPKIQKDHDGKMN